MKAFYSGQFALPLPAGHRFPMVKYGLLRDRIAAELPAVTMLAAPSATDDELALAHTPEYIAAIAQGSITSAAMRQIGFPWSSAMVERSRRSVGATIAAVSHAFSDGVAANMAGGTHHAFSDRGSGYCVFNDVAVAVRLAQARRHHTGKPALRVAIIDLDVHQGNGTARIFRDDTSVFTLSLHGAKNFPFAKETSDLDLALDDGCTDTEYLDGLDRALASLNARFEPDLAVYLAGADPFEGDRLGRLKLSFEGLRRRDLRVFEWCLSRGIPLALTMGGGYGINIHDTVQVQFNTFAVALEFWRCWRVREACGGHTGKIPGDD